MTIKQYITLQVSGVVVMYGASIVGTGAGLVKNRAQNVIYGLNSSEEEVLEAKKLLIGCNGFIEKAMIVGGIAGAAIGGVSAISTKLIK